mgnify:CR=1 FL=1
MPPAGAGADKLIVNVPLVAGSAALVPATAETDNTEPEHGFKAEAVFLGDGAPAAKSAELMLLSVQPFAALKTAFVLDGAGVGPTPSKQFAVVPNPTKSTIVGPVGQLVPEVINVFTFSKAILPAVPAIGIVPLASGVGNEVVPPAPCAC